MGDPPMLAAAGGSGIGEPPIPNADGPATDRRIVVPVKTTNNANKKTMTYFFIALSSSKNGVSGDPLGRG